MAVEPWLVGRRVLSRKGAASSAMSLLLLLDLARRLLLSCFQ